MHEARGEIDTSARAFDRTDVANPLASPSDAAGGATNRRLAASTALSTVVQAFVGVHALATAL